MRLAISRRVDRKSSRLPSSTASSKMVHLARWALSALVLAAPSLVAARETLDEAGPSSVQRFQPLARP